MPLIEQLGTFYLGREVDPAGGQVTDRPVNYDSRDLTTHAVCVGMTGSGKTGLCIDLLEEAAIDGVPAIIIDPKGDITNLLLTFPDLRPEDFLPWINAEDAERRGVAPEAYAAQVAEKWQSGLAGWDQGPDRIRLLRDAADFAIYTPGSEAGLPISILSSFRAPALDWDTEAEVLRERIQGTVSALLGLIGVAADPLRSREHILLANIFEHAWRAGQDLDLAGLILAVQEPPFAKLGVFDLEAFFPPRDRGELAVMLNNLIAAPGFASWIAGEPLDVARLLRDDAGKPRHSIFYIAHLSDAERMFFVTILLEQVIGWMRSQPGTTSLRALLYMDEVFGFFPPIGEPPSKRPLLTLLKQARAFGLGVVLTTQNPADLDYKGLTNAGTWFVGKLQTERDKARLMEGLAGALADSGVVPTDPQLLGRLISSLQERAFLLHDVHAGAPVVFQTRWAMSYLRGPLTRQQIKQLMAPRKAVAAPVSSPILRAIPAATPLGAEEAGLEDRPPELPEGIPQVYLPLTLAVEEAIAAVEGHLGAPVEALERRLVYEPALLGMATVHFVDRKPGIDESRAVACLLLLAENGPAIDWQDAWAITLNAADPESAPQARAAFNCAGLPAAIAGARNLTAQGNAFAEYLYRSQVYALPWNPSLQLYARPGEPPADFSARCQQAAREGRDAGVDRLAAKYGAPLRRLQERLARARQEAAESQTEYAGRQRDRTMAGVASIAGALGLFGRSRTRTAARAATTQRLAQEAREDVDEARAQVKELEADLVRLQAEIRQEGDALTRQWQAAAADLQEVRITPRRVDVDVRQVALAWAASWHITYRLPDRAPWAEIVPAYPMH